MVPYLTDGSLGVLRISKLTDYGTVVLAELAAHDGQVCSAADVSNATGLGLPTVSKLLKSMAHADLVTSTRGVHGGYELARDAHDISAADVIDALEGPVSITECSSTDSHCDFESICNVGGAWQRINVAIRDALDDVSLVDLSQTKSPLPHFHFAGLPIHLENSAGKKPD